MGVVCRYRLWGRVWRGWRSFVGMKRKKRERLIKARKFGKKMDIKFSILALGYLAKLIKCIISTRNLILTFLQVRNKMKECNK